MELTCPCCNEPIVADCHEVTKRAADGTPLYFICRTGTESEDVWLSGDGQYRQRSAQRDHQD